MPVAVAVLAALVLVEVATALVLVGLVDATDEMTTFVLPYPPPAAAPAQTAGPGIEYTGGGEA